MSGDKKSTVRLSKEAVRAARQARRSKERPIALLIYHRDGTELVSLGAPVVVGRSEPATVTISDASLSREHARFWCDGGAVWVEDLGSTNGTFVNGDAIEREPVKPGDEIELGTVGASIVLVSSETPSFGFRPAAGDELVIESAAMKQLFDTIPRIANSNIPVLLLGETGSGKEVVARAIHQGGKTKDGPLVCLNCGAIPPQLVESTLFGHVEGAFTGASGDSAGVFEAADRGTVFLDEIGELPAAAQAALLRVLETKRLSRVGSREEIEIDVRVIAATHRDLDTMVKEGAFREDLLYRLDAMTLSIPPLRERRSEIRELAEHFMKLANRANDRRVDAIDEAALALLESHDWPGNVRELKNAIERAVVIADDNRITAGDLPQKIRARTVERAQASASESEGDLKTRMQRIEAELILTTLERCEWNQTEAAKQLGLPRRTLVHKIKNLGLKKGYRLQ